MKNGSCNDQQRLKFACRTAGRAYSGINIITVLIRLGIIAVTVITAVISMIIFTIYAVTVISSQDVNSKQKNTIVLFVDVVLRAASILENHIFLYLFYVAQV